jgi:hypothetical protein
MKPFFVVWLLYFDGKDTENEQQVRFRVRSFTIYRLQFRPAVPVIYGLSHVDYLPDPCVWDVLSCQKLKLRHYDAPSTRMETSAQYASL